MELIVFDLDGTLLNRKSKISPYTRETLRRLTEKGIAYTVATGRTLHGASGILEGHGFNLPQIFKNGVMVWNPLENDFSQHHLLTLDEVDHVSEAFLERDVTPFLFTLTGENRIAVYHPPLQQKIEYRLVKSFQSEGQTVVHPIDEMPADARISNVSAVGPETAIREVAGSVEGDEHLVAYMGTAIEDQHLSWIDIHHEQGSKGGAVEALKKELGFSRVICFGDSENDLTMFASADEAYAPENAKDYVKEAATAVIGHHDSDGIAKFLRERFELD
ncbi:MAG: HAD family hydrolase [Pseudomonadota bacterium]